MHEVTPRINEAAHSVGREAPLVIVGVPVCVHDNPEEAHARAVNNLRGYEPTSRRRLSHNAGLPQRVETPRSGASKRRAGSRWHGSASPAPSSHAHPGAALPHRAFVDDPFGGGAPGRLHRLCPAPGVCGGPASGLFRPVTLGSEGMLADRLGSRRTTGFRVDGEKGGQQNALVTDRVEWVEHIARGDQVVNF